LALFNRTKIVSAIFGSAVLAGQVGAQTPPEPQAVGEMRAKLMLIQQQAAVLAARSLQLCDPAVDSPSGSVVGNRDLPQLLAMPAVLRPDPKQLEFIGDVFKVLIQKRAVVCFSQTSGKTSVDGHLFIEDNVLLLSARADKTPREEALLTQQRRLMCMLPMMALVSDMRDDPEDRGDIEAQFDTGLMSFFAYPSGNCEYHNEARSEAFKTPPIRQPQRPAP